MYYFDDDEDYRCEWPRHSTPPVPPMSPPPVRRNWPLVVGALVIVIVVCCGLGLWLLDGDPSTAAPGGVVHTPTVIRPPARTGGPVCSMS